MGFGGLNKIRKLFKSRPDQSFSSKFIEKTHAVDFSALNAAVIVDNLYFGYQAYFSQYSIVQIPNVSNVSIDDVKDELSALELKI